MGQTGVSPVKHYSVDTVRRQIAACLSAWGMSPDHVEITADAMVDADTCGIDTHGLSLLVTYDTRLREGTVTIDAKIEVVRQTPVSALVDAGGGLGYVPGVTAAKLAIAKAKQAGIAAVAVRNSNHFGAAGYYTRMIATAGLVGFDATNGAGPRAAPTLGTEAKLSTNPLAFAAPTKRHPTFHLDMATTTVAAGKIRVRDNEGIALPIGWANDWSGNPLTDAHVYGPKGEGGSLSPLGGTPDGASYKGYGLATMVEILSAGLSGASLVTSPNHGHRTPGTMDIGHFFLAIDPTMFRETGGFEETVDQLIDDLHATAPIDPARPVMVAGEPENMLRAERARAGIPVPPGIREKIRDIAARSGAEFLLG